jgi:hypothetical protein
MPERHEVRICLRPIPGFQVEISLFDVVKRKEQRLGMKAGPRQYDIDAKVMHIKTQLEKNGAQVNVVNLDRRW